MFLNELMGCVIIVIFLFVASYASVSVPLPNVPFYMAYRRYAFSKASKKWFSTVVDAFAEIFFQPF